MAEKNGHDEVTQWLHENVRLSKDDALAPCKTIVSQFGLMVEQVSESVDSLEIDDFQDFDTKHPGYNLEK